MSSWWLIWMLFVFLFLAPSLGYGWGYRGWGPPYPRYIQRRRRQQAGARGDPATFNHESWGRIGDLVWIVVLLWMLWACFGLLWH
jgi:hypothetical protein